MKHPYWLPMSAAVLAMALAVSLPAAARSQERGHSRGGGHSSVGGGGRSNSGNHGSVRGGGRSYSGNRGSSRGGERRSYGGGDRGSWRGSGSRGSYRSDVRYREPRSDYRADQRYRDAGRGGRDGRTYNRDGRYHGGDHRTSYSSYTRYRRGGSSYSHHHPHHYYTGHFHRPDFIYRSGFSLGFVIGLAPSYGYRYLDPYCDISFRHLGAYYDHCYDRGHSEVILVVDANGGYPIATCVYRGGAWVVDDRYDDGY